jgi:AcrR family transcriptional regulator
MKVGKPYHHQNLRGALLAAALDLIRQKGGSHGFTLREVARRAEVSHTAPYRHFRDKDDLLGAIAGEGFLRLAALVRAAVAKDWYPVRRLRNAALAYVEFALDQPDQYRVMFSVDLDGELPCSAKPAAQAFFEAVVALVGDCPQFGPMRAGDSLSAARIVCAQVHGIAELAVRGRFGFKSRTECVQLATIAIEALEKGMGWS